ncbi:MAG TPA: DUF2235 domain-containing protein [Verrucomicrobiae bacterium]|nr:DUF2235 domain-containing protein [Verrucomicrobiae bacterium]
MSKNIVICCDGTGNEFRGDGNSNVVKLYSTLIINETQIGYYHPGVGTMGSPTARTWIEKHWSRIKGLAFGAGLLDNVADAYRYLMDAYADGDQVFLFGFSRGSYTARVLAGVLHMYGLLCPGNEGLIPYVVQMFAGKARKAAGMKETLEVAENFKATFSRDCPLHFEGLWDTVSSVGWVFSPLVLPFSARNPSMRVGRHAVSIHERRCYYRQNLWGAPFEGQDIKQVWFAGVHSDIGGSYPEAESGLSKVTLEWMLHEAAGAGLRIDPDRAAVVLGKAPPPEAWMPRYVVPDGQATMHQSLRGAWWILELMPHRYVDFRSGKPVVRWRIPLGAFRRIPRESTIYELAKPLVPAWDESFKIERAVTFPT